MKHLAANALALVSVFVSVSCESEKQPATFYAIDSLISGQINYLTEMKAGLFKEALLSGKTDTVRFTPADTVGWKKELDVFRKLDEINKPVNKGRYEVSDGLLDPSSNLTIKEFKSKEPLPVLYLKIYYQGNKETPVARGMDCHLHDLGDRPCVPVQFESLIRKCFYHGDGMQRLLDHYVRIREFILCFLR